MKAVGYRHSLPANDPASLLDIELPEPVVSGRDLLVRVAAVSVNPVDAKQRKRVDPRGGEPRILGWDAAGTVVAAGPQVSGFQPGDQVYYAGAVDRPGSNAELQLVDERIVGRKPSSVDFAGAAALPLTSITAWELLFDRFGIRAGPQMPAGFLLVIGAAGGVGSMAVQLARRLTGLTVIGTASRPASRAWVETLGAHHVVDHHGDLPAQVRAIAPGGIDYVLSLTHTEQHYPAIVELLRPQGHLALIDDPAESIDIRLLKGKSISLHWESMFTRSLYQTEDMHEQRRLLDEVADLVDAGVLRSTLREHLGRINAHNLRTAHQRIEAGATIGKLVLEGF